VGVIKELVLLPVAPARFTVWVIDQVAQDVDRRQNSPQARMERLREIEAARERGEIHEEEAAQLEAAIIEEASPQRPAIEKEEGADDG
jgi:hypothetical protein